MVLGTAFEEYISSCSHHQTHPAHRVARLRASSPLYSKALKTQTKPLLDFERFGKNARDPEVPAAT